MAIAPLKADTLPATAEWARSHLEAEADFSFLPINGEPTEAKRWSETIPIGH